MAISQVHNSNYGLFTNLQDVTDYGRYWSGTTYPADSNYAWEFGFGQGGQTWDAKGQAHFVIAVITGDIAASLAVCPPPQVAQGSNCTLTLSLGWGIAGLGTRSVVVDYLPPTASGPVTFTLTSLNSSLGSSYTGFFGLMATGAGGSGSAVITGGSQVVLSPGQTAGEYMVQVCWSPSCRAAAPANAVPNMFSLQGTISSPSPADVALASLQLTAQFVNGSQVSFQESETGQLPGPNVSYIPGINIGATPAGRYVYSGTAVTQPYDVLSVTNAGNSPITGTVTLVDANGATVATASVPSIPVNGAAGFLVIGRSPGDSLGLFSASTVLPAASDNIFHGTLVVSMSGTNVTLAQEFDGDSMLNLLVLH
jgi:hypothetical protein